MQNINYAAFAIKIPKNKISTPIATMGIGAVSVLLIIAGPLYFADFLQSIDTLIVLFGLLLFVALIFLLYWHIYENQLKRDKLLRAFAKDNGFIFTSTPATLGNDHIPEFVSDSSLLARVSRFDYRVTPRSNMSLSGTYVGMSFAITIVGMYWRRRDGRQGVSYFGTCIIVSEKLRSLPHIVALSKAADRLSSALNSGAVHEDGWSPAVIGWQANAHYDVFKRAFDSEGSVNDPRLSEMLAAIHEIDQSDVEIVDGGLYAIKFDGIDFSEKGFQPIFDKIRAAARYMNNDTP